VYYHHTGLSTPDTAQASFYFDPIHCAHANWVSRNRTGTPASAIINSASANDSIMLIQDLPGTQADLKIPNISTFPKPVVVNKAQIVITKVSPTNAASDSTFSSPLNLFVVGIDATGATYTIADRYPVTSSNPLSFIDGSRQYVNINGVTCIQYVINIPAELQRCITTGIDTLHLRISGTGPYIGGSRLVAGGGTYSNPNYQVKLKVVYTKIN
jgi:hypothetical protein